MKIKFEHLGQNYELEAQQVKDQIWVHFQGETFTVASDSQKRKQRQASGAGKSGKLLAPMPGKVTKILKSVGDLVAVGDSLIVMEAMKMEYTLKAEIAGKLSALNCKAGEQVALGHQLGMVVP